MESLSGAAAATSSRNVRKAAIMSPYSWPPPGFRKPGSSQERICGNPPLEPEGGSDDVTTTSLRSQQFKDRGVRHAAALAHRLQAVADPVVAHVVEHRRHDPRAGAAERVTERDRAAARVELLRVGAVSLQPGQRHRGERLVHLEHADVVERQAGALERLLRWPGSAPVSMITGSSPATTAVWIRASGVSPSSRPSPLVVISSAAAAVGDLRGVAGGESRRRP